MPTLDESHMGSVNIKVKFAQERGITSFKITDPGELVTYYPKEGEKGEPKTRLVIGVQYNGQQPGDPKKWNMNGQCMGALATLWGNRTENWVGKAVEITITGTGDFQSIAVDTLRTQNANPQQQQQQQQIQQQPPPQPPSPQQPPQTTM